MIKTSLLWAHFICFMQGTMATLRNTCIRITEACGNVVLSFDSSPSFVLQYVRSNYAKERFISCLHKTEQ